MAKIIKMLNVFKRSAEYIPGSSNVNKKIIDGWAIPRLKEIEMLFQSGDEGDYEDDRGIVPEPGAVVINEMLAHSHAEAADWIELHNTTGTSIDIGSSNILLFYSILSKIF